MEITGKKISNKNDPYTTLFRWKIRVVYRTIFSTAIVTPSTIPHRLDTITCSVFFPKLQLARIHLTKTPASVSYLELHTDWP